MAGQQHLRAAKALLEVLTREDLRDIADEVHLKRSGNKGELVQSIAAACCSDLDLILRHGPLLLETWRDRIEEHHKVRVHRSYDAVQAWAWSHVAEPNPEPSLSSQPRSLGMRPEPGVEMIQDLNPPVALWDYQHQAVAALERTLRPGHGGILQLPTGAGKTKTAVWWLLSHLAKHGGRALWLAGRTELIGQAAATVRAHAALRGQPFTLEIVEGGAPGDFTADIMIASVPTLARRKTKARDIDRHGHVSVVVYDEAHHAPAPTYHALLRDIEVHSRSFLGLTATPTRTSESERPVLARLFPGRVLFEASYVDLMRQGFLAAPETRLINLEGKTIEITAEHQAYIKRWGALPPAILDSMMRDEVRSTRVATEVAKAVPSWRPMIVFAIGRADGQRITTLLAQRGVRAEYVDGETPRAQRERILQDLRDQRIDVAVNVNVLTEGTDVPGLRGVVIARPTFSETLYRQMVGRGSRGPRLGGKESFAVIDFADNFARFTDHLAHRYALAEEIGPDVARPSPAVKTGQTVAVLDAPSATRSELPDAVIDQWRVELAGLIRRTPTPDPVGMTLSGWWSWLDGDYREYLIVFIPERVFTDRIVRTLRERLSTVSPDSDTAQQMADQFWDERAFGSSISREKIRSLVRAIVAGRPVTYQPFQRQTEPDLLHLATAAARGGGDLWLTDRFFEHPQWSMYYPTCHTFVAAVHAAAERAANNDTARGSAAFSLAEILDQDVDVTLISVGERPDEVRRLIRRLVGLSEVDAEQALRAPNSVIARGIKRGAAQEWASAFRQAGARLQIT